jgi:hypothetical protein
VSDLPVYATLAALSGPVLFMRGFGVMRTQRLIANTPTARVRSMAMGLVEIKGTVTPRSTLTAPFTGRPCAYWEVDIATQARRSYTVIHRNQSGHPFYLRDETGVALVYPKGAKLTLHYGREEECLGVNLPECYAAYLRENGSLATTLARFSALRFRERILEEGQVVYVLGTATPRAQARNVSDEETLAATGTDDWSGGRVRTLDSEVSAIVRQGSNERTFIVSQDSERTLTLMMGLQSWAMLVGGPILALFGLGYWLMAWKSG